MQSLRFDFYGSHQLLIPDGEIYCTTAEDVISQRSYPFPLADSQLPVQSVVDLGAHAGEYTIMAAARWPNAIIHAFEPNPQILPLLHQNCKPYGSIVIHEQAVGVHAHRGKLFFNGLGSLAAEVLLEPARYENYATPQNSVDVAIVGADAISGLSPDVLKIDIEGCERFVLEAMGSAVARIGRIHVEFHQEFTRKYIDMLLQHTHSLEYARINEARQGEVMYTRQNNQNPAAFMP